MKKPMKFWNFFGSKEENIDGLEDEAGNILESLDNKDEIWLKDWYYRLKEKFKFNVNKRMENVLDWKDYLENVRQIYYASMAMGGGDEDGSLGETIREASIRAGEIENRFASLLE
jgi:hypothetical protein